MSDKLEKCVCGGEGRCNRTHFCDKEGKRYFISSCRKCFSATPLYTSEEEAATAWSVMQRALKSGWSSEVPTEEGHYWFVGEMICKESGRTAYLAELPQQVYWPQPNNVNFEYVGHWCPCNYPLTPPKD